MKKRGWAAALLGAVLVLGCSSSEPTKHPRLEAGTDAGDGGVDAPSDAPSEADAGTPAFCDAGQAQQAMSSLNASPSCVLACPKPCDEATKPWTCPALAPWAALPHDCSASACGSWDGTYPAPVAGHCTASAPSGDAIAQTDATGTPVILPDGRRLDPAGVEVRLLNTSTVQGTFPANALWIPNTHFVAVSDVGYGDNLVRILDADKLAAGQDPVASELVYPSPQSLNYGLALAPSGTLYAASGAPDSVIRAFRVDQTGQIAAAANLDVPVGNVTPGDAFPSGIAISPDGVKLAVGQVNSPYLLVYSLAAASYGQKIADVDLGAGISEVLGVYFDPASSDVVYAAAWRGGGVIEVNLSDPANPTLRTIPTGKQPEQVAFISSTTLVVSNSLDDDLSIVDRASAQIVGTVPVDAKETLHGSAPSSLAFDAASGRLYVTLAGRNGVAVFSVGQGDPPTLSPLGVLPTGWWPTAVSVANVAASDPLAGSIVVLNGRGHGIGPQTPQQGYASGVTGARMSGSAEYVAPSDMASLTDATNTWETDNDVGDLVGHSTVSCSGGAANDFPVPSTNTAGASQQIQHVVFIVRENKTFDAVMGDLTGVDGDPSLVMAPGAMNQVWPNTRKIAQTFAQSDNFYEDAEQSIQGHFWTAFGRTSDYTERTWMTTWGRGTRGSIPIQGVAPDTQPVEGSVFAWLKKNKVAYDDMGELLGGGTIDPDYGIVSTSGTVPDTKSACFIAGRTRLLCNMKPFTYVWLVNDHTFGGQAGKPNPGLMISVNDEATGMIVDAISHSPMWPSTLIIVIEDDPGDGADHVDTHRTIVLFASPWVKRGYLSETHFDVSSLHKLFANIFGIPYNNLSTEYAALPLDIFTSTPDYTPYTYLQRTFTDLSCNPATGAAAAEAAAHHWDFSEPDDQPGLDQQVRRMLQHLKTNGK
jgi:hypothetical protein